MRLGVVLDLAVTPAGQVAEHAASVESNGLELLWLRPAAERPFETLPAAAGCATALVATQVVAEVSVGGSHPVYLAEERNVVDQLLGGRLTLALRSDEGDGAELTEWAEVLLQAARTVPFEHEGPRFRIPAGLEGNSVNREDRVVVTPPPLGLDPQVWVAGHGALDAAVDLGLSVVDESFDAGTSWASLTELLGRRALRLRRPAVRSWSPATEDATSVAKRLAAERDAWGLDCVLVALDVPPTDPTWKRALADLQGVVRPRVQAQQLPDGLEEFWSRERHVGAPSSSSLTGPTTSER